MSINLVCNRATRSISIKARVILTSLLLSGTALSAQSIAGTVQTAGKPIVGATVRLLELDRIEHTGAEGQFAFSNVPAGVYRVYVGVTGYASATDTIRVRSGTARVSFNLRESAIHLKEVVVSASPTARTSDEQYQSTASKSLVEFQNSPGTKLRRKDLGSSRRRGSQSRVRSITTNSARPRRQRSADSRERPSHG